MFAKLCLTLFIKLWVILRLQCITVGYISKQNRIKIKTSKFIYPKNIFIKIQSAVTKQIIFNFNVGLF